MKHKDICKDIWPQKEKEKRYKEVVLAGYNRAIGDPIPQISKRIDAEAVEKMIKQWILWLC